MSVKQRLHRLEGAAASLKPSVSIECWTIFSKEDQARYEEALKRDEELGLQKIYITVEAMTKEQEDAIRASHALRCGD
jgi:hypothetical protein